MNDTIAAISTALGIGAISIIRVSGDKSIEIVNKIFNGKDLTKVPSHTIHYGHIVDKEEIIDEVLVTVMKSPRTFTTEDIVEINSHGGISTTNRVLEILLTNGARLAEPGEFTKRAFLNGRIDLIEADGIMNLISAKTEKARKLSINQLNGQVTNNIKSLREKLISIISNIEGTITLNGILLKLIDTAGIRKTNNIVEKIGVEKSKQIIDKSDLVILILNNNEQLTKEDLNLLSSIKNKKHLILLNKIDLENKLDLNRLDEEYISISIKDNKGIDKLKQKIIELFNLEQLETEDLTYISDARSISLLKKALNYIEESINSINNNDPIDIVEINIKDAWESLGEIIGETYTEELIDNLFERFCLGK